eukprot:gnl/MRDRNA2_/MRDRNA2_103475_c0_seq1.p1 gnl/MRDRNA2_/MRDRNA2_103475_c0~~gnl/MRDRNA2_/MRDRNA2_103475_c0_seq1.p1  ORF type:complete len:153 (+),score=21.87 gnl/MRDRNA2_/MRDRNA2_103475_c0_seq1:61-519(+)
MQNTVKNMSSLTRIVFLCTGLAFMCAMHSFGVNERTEITIDATDKKALVSLLQSNSFLRSTTLRCSEKLDNAFGNSDFDFVCDTTVPWLHFAGGSDWADATPPEGTGCHSYVAYKGTAPSGCSVGKSCSACSSPEGKAVSTVKYMGGSCESC